MGQVVGKISVHPDAVPFMLLPGSIVMEVREAFHDIAEGFGLTLEEFQNIIRISLKEYLDTAEIYSSYFDQKLTSMSQLLFQLYHRGNESNELVDSFEFICSICLLSGMSISDKLNFVFEVFDFDESGMISVEELTLMLRCCLLGLSKACNELPTPSDIPKDSDLAAFASIVFDPSITSTLTEQYDGGRVMLVKASFIEFASNIPEIRSWLDCLKNIEDIERFPPNGSITNPLKNHVEHKRATFEQSLHLKNSVKSSLNHSMIPCHVKDLSENNTLKQSRYNSSGIVEGEGIKHIASCDIEYPSHTLKLKWVYGLNGFNTKNHVHYIPHSDDVIYPAGSICVKLTSNRNEQHFYFGHTDYVTCISMRSNKKTGAIAASGDLATKPSIHIWSPKTMTLHTVLQGFHKVGIQALDFSPTNSYLISIGMDSKHSAAIYNWNESTLLFTTQTTSCDVTDISFLGSSDSFGVCGNNYVSFWEFSSVDATFIGHRGLFGTKITKQRMNCIVHFNGKNVTGAESGHVCVWEGRNCIASYKEHHSGSVEIMHVILKRQILCVGTSEGIIQLWNESFEINRLLNIDHFGLLKLCINSLTWCTNSGKFLVASESNEVVEVDEDSGDINELLIQGHFGGSFQGVASSPLHPSEFITAGRDGTLRVWNTVCRKSVRMVQFDAAIGCVNYAPHAKVIALGFGSKCKSKKSERDGSFMILCTSSLTILHESRNSKMSLIDCKFSSDTNILLFASMDGSVYIYDGKNFLLKARTKRQSMPIMCVDFGAVSGNEFFRSKTEMNDIFIWDLAGEQVSSRIVQNAEWKTSSCTIDNSSLPFYSSDGALATSCCHSQNGYSIIGDNFGRINMFTYPISVKKCVPFWCYRGHGTEIGGATFSSDGKSLLTIGLEDCCIFQWEVCPQNAQIQNVSSSYSITYANEKIFDCGHLWNDIASERCSSLCNLEILARDIDFVPSSQWQKAIVAPSHDVDENLCDPDHDIVLEHIHGYNTELRSNVYYGKDNNVIYSAANIVVQQHLKTRTQSFYKDSKNQILCIAFHSQKNICAVGQAGEDCFIHVADMSTRETIQVLQGQHTTGISNLAFDSKGEYLVTIGCDEMHLLIIYHWKTGTIAHHCQTTKNQTLDIDFKPDSSGVIQCGVGFINFWGIQQYIHSIPVDLADSGKLQSFYAIGWIGNTPVVGTDDGHLYMFSTHKLERSFKAHVSAVNTLCSTVEGIMSGSKDGCVKIWNSQLECKYSIDTKTYTKHLSLSAVMSMDWDIETSNVVVGLANNEIWEFQFDKSYHDCLGQIISKGIDRTSDGKALAVHPTENRFITVGNSKTLFLWNISDVAPTKMIELEMASLCCSFSPCGTMIAVGFGSLNPNPSCLDGKWIIMIEDDDFNVAFEARDSVKPVSEIKWSHNGELIAICTWDANIYIYTLQEDSICRFQLLHVLRKHNAVITDVDFSLDGLYLRSNCSAHELYYWDLKKGTSIKSHSCIRKTQWHTQNCSLSWASQGVWPRENDGTNILSIDLNTRGNIGDRVLATADNYGRVKLYRFPCLSHHYPYKVYKGHCGTIFKVRWIGTGSHLVTLGQYDKTIFVYRHDVDDEAIMDTHLQEGCNTKHERADMFPKPSVISIKEALSNPLFGVTNTSKPWLSQIVEPSIPMSIGVSIEEPKAYLDLCHIFGMNSSFSEIVATTSVGDVIFPCAFDCIILQKSSRRQLFYREHTSNISCLCLAPNGFIMATGEHALEPNIMIWDVNTCTTISSISKYHWTGISCVQFSPDSKSLVSVGNEYDHSMILWQSPSGNWNDWYLQARVRCGIESIFFAKFLGMSTAYNIVTGGRKHMKFWKIDGPHLHASQALYQDKGHLCDMLCGCKFKHMFVTGTGNGHIYAWSDRSLTKVLQITSRPITSLFSSGDFLWVGSKGIVMLLSTSLENLRSYHIGDEIHSVNSIISSNNPSPLEHLIIANNGGEVYELSAASGGYVLLHESHNEGELWGLSIHPLQEDLFATCGNDGVLRIWDITQLASNRKLRASHEMRCVAWTNDGKHLIVGYGKHLGAATKLQTSDKDGVFIVVNAKTMKIEFEGKVGDHVITDIKLSPDNKLIAFGSSNGNIYVHFNDFTMNFKQISCVSQHSEGIYSMDFSTDSSSIQSCSLSNHTLRHYNVVDGETIRLPSLVKNTPWATQNCLFGWTVQGAWESQKNTLQHSDPSSLDRSHNCSLLAVGNCSGAVKIFNFPTVSSQMKCTLYTGHIGAISNCRFTCCDRYLLTIGYLDRSIYLWKILYHDK